MAFTVQRSSLIAALRPQMQGCNKQKCKNKDPLCRKPALISFVLKPYSILHFLYGRGFISKAPIVSWKEVLEVLEGTML